MENASKALLIAGGILLAIITLSLVVYMMSAVRTMAEAQDAKALSEQITAFNKEYESYNKRIMYGTDVITVVKKAINFNGGLDADESDYFINIKLNLTSDFKTTKKIVTRYASGRKEEKEEYVSSASLGIGLYELKVKDGSTKINQNIINFFAGNTSNSYSQVKYSTKIEDIYEYSALTNFKTAIFECTDVTYDPNTGRISDMEFEQTKSATH